MKKSLRRSIDTSLTVAGMVIIFSSFLFETTMETQSRFMLVVLGVLFLEVGVWGLSNRILPSERKFTGLRKEGDKMLALIRQLNAAAIAKDKGEEDAKRFQDTLAKMHDSVKKMAECAAEQQ